MSSYAILDENKKPIPADLDTWYEWLKKGNGRVDLTRLSNYEISTVFVGISTDAWTPLDRQYFWETMVFSEGVEQYDFDLEKYTRRYNSHEAALVGHQEIVQAIAKTLDLEDIL